MVSRPPSRKTRRDLAQGSLFVAHILQEICQHQPIERAIGKWQRSCRHRHHAIGCCRFPRDVTIRNPVPVELGGSRWHPGGVRSHASRRSDFSSVTIGATPVALAALACASIRTIVRCARIWSTISLHPLPEEEVSIFLQRIVSSVQPVDGNTRDPLSSQFWFRNLAGNPDPRPNQIYVRAGRLARNPATGLCSAGAELIELGSASGPGIGNAASAAITIVQSTPGWKPQLRARCRYE